MQNIFILPTVLHIDLLLGLHIMFSPELVIPALIALLLLFFVVLVLLIVSRTKEKKKYLHLLERHLEEIEKSRTVSREHEKNFQQTLEFFNEGLLFVNESGIVLFANSITCKLLGIPYSKLIRQPLPPWLISSGTDRATILNKLSKGGRFSETVKATHCNQTFWLNVKWTWNPTPENEPGAALLITNITDKVLFEEKIQQLTSETNEKSKQINCLFDISDISGVPNITFEGIIERSLQIIPGGLKYSHDAWAEIIFSDKRFATSNFIETPWTFSAPIKIRQKKLGQLRVGYTEEKPKNLRDAFHLNEKLLIKSLAERLGQIIELVDMENRFKVLCQKK